MKILITGTTGFAGARLVEEILGQTDWEIYSLERITARPNQLGALASSSRIHHIYHDFRAEIPTRILEECEGMDYIVHCGAEVHGLHSLENPELYVHTNVMGTFNLLEAARVLKPKKFLYVSSAEAVGGAPASFSWNEDVALKPSNPYAAAKGAGEMLCRSYFQSFQVPTNIVRVMNIFGERQDTSKFLPMTIKKVLAGQPVVCHIDETGKSGSRHWIYVGVFVKALFNLLIQSTVGETYHVVGPEISNLDVIRDVERGLHRRCNLQYQQPGPSHDMRYSIKDTKLSNLTYDTRGTKQDLLKTVAWYQENQEWLQ